MKDVIYKLRTLIGFTLAVVALLLALRWSLSTDEMTIPMAAAMFSTFATGLGLLFAGLAGKSLGEKFAKKE